MEQPFKRRRDDYGQAINTSDQQLQLEATVLALSSKEIQDSVRRSVNNSGENNDEESDEDEKPMATVEESLNETDTMVDGDEYEVNESDDEGSLTALMRSVVTSNII